MIEAVDHNGRKGNNDGETRRRVLTEPEWRFIRLAALLHDIGHLAAGHTVEDELCLVGKHDADQRLDKIFDSSAWGDENGRTLAAVIDNAYARYVPHQLRRVKPSVLVRLLIRKTTTHPKTDPHAADENSAAGASNSTLTATSNFESSNCTAVSSFQPIWQAGSILTARQSYRHHPGWYHLVLFHHHYRKRDYEVALQTAKRINMLEFQPIRLKLPGTREMRRVLTGPSKR